MTLTEALKNWVRENKEVVEDANDDVYQKAVAEALVDGSLTAEKATELTKDPDADKALSLNDKLDSVLTAIQDGQKNLTDVLQVVLNQQQDKKPEPNPEMKKVNSGVTDSTIASAKPVEDGETKARVVGAHERYSTSTSAKYFPHVDPHGRPHPLAGKRFREGERTIDEPSELHRAIVGAFSKWQLFREPIRKGQLPSHFISDHDRELVQYAAHNLEWGGVIADVGSPDGEKAVNRRRLTPGEIKQVYDSAATGGDEIVPVIFDEQIITTPLLHSEFYPRVNVLTLPRGRVVEAGTIPTNPTLTWRAQEQTATIALNSTAGFVGEFNTNIYTISGAIQFGLDFLSDTPTNFGDVVTQRYGEALLNALDDAIVSGDGTSAPTGIRDQGTAVAFGSAWSTTNLVSLMLTIGKEYKRGFDNNRICYGAHPSSYMDCRGIATGVTGDTRLVFGEDINSYMCLGHPFLVNDTYGTAEMNAVNLARYRMYRRLGLTATTTTDGDTLVRANQLLLSVRGRFGGQLEDTNACAYTDSGA
jgi:HK97 family phage major capsid protein